MAVTSFWYGTGLLKVQQQSVNWATDTIKAALVRSTYTPNQDSDSNYNDITAAEAPATGGYTTGGLTIANRSIAYDAATNEVRFLGDDVTWAASTITARYLVIYDDTPSAGSKWLLGYVNFGADQASSSSSFPISFSGRKVLRITAL